MVFSKQGLANLEKSMAGHVDRGIPGVVALVYRRGETHVTVLGRDYERDTIFRIASMSKPITAVAAMILVEEGRLRLDDSLDDLLPELASRKVLRTIESEVCDTVPAKRSITLRDLLTFRFGHGFLMAAQGTYPFQADFAERFGPPGPPRPSETPAPDEWMRRIGSVPLLAQPGDRWFYHLGSEILGVLIARVSGQYLGDFMKERIFDPLGMKDTGFHVPEEKIGRLRQSIGMNFETGEEIVYDEAAGGEWSRPPAFPSGGGGLVSTADDFLAFGQMLLRGGAPILSRPTVELMTTNHLTLAQQAHGEAILQPGRGWGFGMAVVTDRTGYPNVGSFGWDGGLGTSFLADPKEDLIGILLTQKMWTNPVPPAVCADFRTLSYAAIAE